MDTKKITAYLDRVELCQDDSRTAVFYIEDEEDDFRQFNLPADFLPDDAAEGEYFSLTISREVETTKQSLDEARELLSNLEE